MKKRLLKPLEIAIFALEIINLGLKKYHYLWTISITNVKYLLKIMIENLIKLWETYFSEKLLDLTSWVIKSYSETGSFPAITDVILGQQEFSIDP